MPGNEPGAGSCPSSAALCLCPAGSSSLRPLGLLMVSSKLWTSLLPPKSILPTSGTHAGALGPCHQPQHHPNGAKQSKDAAGLEEEQQKSQLGSRKHQGGMHDPTSKVPSKDQGPRPLPATAWWASAAGSHQQSTDDGVYCCLISCRTPHLPLGNLMFASILPNQRERSRAGAVGEGGGEPRESGADGLHYQGGDDISAQLQRIRPLFSWPLGLISPL